MSAFIFDLDRTLFDHDGAEESAVREIHKGSEFAEKIPFDSFLKQWRFDLEESAGEKIGLISNGNLAQQQRKLETCKIAHHFQAVVVSEEVGFTKPAPEIFHIACDRLGVKLQESFCIGDRWDLDVAGAYNAGLQGVWLNRFGEKKPESSLQPIIVTELSGLRKKLSANVITQNCRQTQDRRPY